MIILIRWDCSQKEQLRLFKTNIWPLQDPIIRFINLKPRIGICMFSYHFMYDANVVFIIRGFSIYNIQYVSCHSFFLRWSWHIHSTFLCCRFQGSDIPNEYTTNNQLLEPNFTASNAFNAINQHSFSQTPLFLQDPVSTIALKDVFLQLRLPWMHYVFVNHVCWLCCCPSFFISR